MKRKSAEKAARRRAAQEATFRIRAGTVTDHRQLVVTYRRMRPSALLFERELIDQDRCDLPADGVRACRRALQQVMRERERDAQRAAAQADYRRRAARGQLTDEEQRERAMRQVLGALRGPRGGVTGGRFVGTVGAPGLGKRN